MGSKEDRGAIWGHDIPENYTLLIAQGGSYYVCLVFQDENHNVIAVYRNSEPLFAKTYY